MLLRRSKLINFFLATVISFFAIPLGLGNDVAQPISLLFFLVFYLLFFSVDMKAIFFLFFVAVNSLLQVFFGMAEEYSIYQFFRSFITFSFFILILASYGNVYEKLSLYLNNNNFSKVFFDRCLLFLACGHLFQSFIFIFYNVDIANAASKNVETFDRILLYPSTAVLLVFMYSLIFSNYYIMFFSSISLILTGSKTVLFSMSIVFLIVFLSRFSVRKLLTYGAGLFFVIFVAVSTDAVVVQRILDYSVENQMEDVTREFEISHAKESMQQNIYTILFGKGLASSLTPGVPSNDDKWFFNSKYDIENAYWSILPKLGIFGFVFICFLYRNVVKDYIGVAVLMIHIVFGFKTSYQYFTTFDGVYLLFFCMLLQYCVKRFSQDKGVS